MTASPFVTDRLVVREFVPSDRDALLAFVREPGQLKYMLFSLATEEAVDAFLAEAMSRPADGARAAYHLAVCERGDARVTGECVGCVSIMREGPSSSEAEIGYFFRMDKWGRGYAAEASAPVIDFGFSSLGLHRVWGKCHSENKGSARVMEKLGMSYEGTMREHAWMGDHWRSSLLYAVLDREWAQRRQTAT
jgi:[ribosomal protein S5]-alanine N-acetyltransferase